MRNIKSIHVTPSGPIVRFATATPGCLPGMRTMPQRYCYEGHKGELK